MNAASKRTRIFSSVEASWGHASDYNGSIETESENLEKNDENVQDVNKLSHFKVCLFATILEDIIAQFRILDECNTELRISKTMCEMTSLLAHKYGVAPKAVNDELDDIDPHNLNCLEYKLRKLHADRKFVLKVFEDFYVNLSKERQFKTFSDYVSQLVEMNVYQTKLMEDEAKNRMLRRELNRQLRQQRNHIKSVTYDTDTEIGRLKSNLGDADLTANMRSRYVGGWQLARSEQHAQAISDLESGPTRTIEYYKLRADQEQHVHTEVELLMNIRTNEILEEVERWMNKYEKDMEKMDLRIQLKKNEYEATYDRRINLEETIETHGELMKNWVTFKDEREAARQYREKMHSAAITVQAWWRGLLVRLQLGPYKVVKKKGAAKADEKSKKKK